MSDPLVWMVHLTTLAAENLLINLSKAIFTGEQNSRQKPVEEEQQEIDLQVQQLREALWKTVEIFKEKLETFHGHLLSNEGRNPVASNSKLAMMELLKKNESEMEKLNFNSPGELLDCKDSIEDTMRNIVYFIVYGSVEKECKIDPDFQEIQSDEAKNFWINSFGPEVSSIPSDIFADRYCDYFRDRNNWTAVTCRNVTRQSVRNVVRSILGKYAVFINFQF
jgi:hypothetical protein